MSSAESVAGRALRYVGAPRPGLLPPKPNKVQINPGFSFCLDEKPGSRHFRGLASLLDHPTAHDGMRRVVHTRPWFSPPSGSVVIDQIDIGDILTRNGKKVLRLDPNFATRNPLS